MTIVGFLLVAGILTLLVFLLKFWFRQGYYDHEIQKARQKKNAELLPKYSDNESPKKISSKVHPENSTQEKGYEFEKYVTSLFPKSAGFQLMEWRGDKYHNGIYAHSNHYPDLEYRVEMGQIRYEFALECKWRSDFFNNKIQICEYYQLKHYREFAINRKVEVAIVLGVGGTPSTPHEIFLIPLAALRNTYIYRNQILPYKKTYTDQPFGVNQGNGALR